MADTGINWSAWALMEYSGGTDVDGIDVNDEATLTTDEVDLDNKAACEISAKWVEGNDGAVDGDIYIYILREFGDGTYQTIDDNPAIGAVIDVAQNASRSAGFSISPASLGSFKILVDNDSGQDGDLSLYIRTGTIPPAS